MALINCPECNREVSDKAEICPSCGFGVAKYIERQNKISKIQEEAEKEAYLYVKRKKKEEKENVEREKRVEAERKNSIYNEAVSKYESELSRDVEKAEELFLTISDWKDSKEYLNKCTDRISELSQREKIREENCKRRNKKIIFATVFMGVCIGLIIGSYSFYEKVVVPRNIYESAMHSIQNRDYEKAIEKLRTIADYKDAAQQIEIVSEEIYERDYSNAKELIAERKYAEALEILKNLENREDISELITICENSMQYEKAISLAENENYRDAIEILEAIGDFKDSAIILEEYRLEADYLDAINDINSGAYGNAFNLLENLGDYKDAKEKFNELCYQLGMMGFEKQNYTAAKKYLEEIADIKDVADIISECDVQLSYANLYSTALNSISACDLYNALDCLKQLPSDYRDVTAKIELCNTYKNVVGEWKCVGYEASAKTWITDEKACSKHDFIVKLDGMGNLSLANYEYDYDDLEYTGTILSWTVSGTTHKLNISTGTLTYALSQTNKESYVHLAP